MEQITQILEQIDLITAASFVVGIVIGAAVTAVAKRGSGQESRASESPPQVPQTADPQGYTDSTQWLLKKQDLSGSQRQILEFIERSPETSIQAVQDRFAKVPDRELFYRLEQIHLMGFVNKARKGDQVVYSLSASYGSAVEVPEDDKTVFIPRD